jgi:hypothetical protein
LVTQAATNSFTQNYLHPLLAALTFTFIAINSILELSDIIASLIGLLALLVSIIAMGISDKKIPEIDIKLEVWKKENNKVDEYYRTMFKVYNVSSQPINDAIITIKLPDNVFKIPAESGEDQFKKITYGRTDILNTDFFRYFSTDQDNNAISFEALIKLDDPKWTNEKRKIYFTVSGINMKAKTIVINKEDFKEIISSSFKNPAMFS